ncbi:hypothetical protein CAEBREN_19327 [Caenorhabditis brenneri]|uniref:CUT domain-containing protein n=1 Tax=Caenorhabditis brenneri TaxID=135651 RepID=G0P796_CAEBE|nr:hypothetical protein CAEBREN_19327 [Caenorhabditis brenneri]
MDPADDNLNSHDDELENQNVKGNQYPMNSSAKVDQNVSQKPLSQKIEDMLNVKRDDIDTKELGKTILTELSSLNIPQEVFAARLVNRSKRTLSDLLSRPKPWNVIKASRTTYVRMYNWMMLPKETKLAIFYEKSAEISIVGAVNTPVRNVNNRKCPSAEGEHGEKSTNPPTAETAALRPDSDYVGTIDTTLKTEFTWNCMFDENSCESSLVDPSELKLLVAIEYEEV